jgi:hypothetical protein
MFQKGTKGISIINILTLLVAIAAPIIAAQKAEAANFSQAYVRLDRMQASPTYTSGLICAKPGSQASQTHDVQVTFPTGFTVGTAGNWTVDTSNLPSGTSAWTNITTASNVASRTVTFAMTSDATLATGTIYCFNWTNTSAALQNPAAGSYTDGVITTRTSGAATIDTSNFALYIVTSDQITVNATVPPNFTFTFTGGTDNFSSNLSTTSVVSTTGKTAQVTTNASNGWVMWVKSANAALSSSSTSSSIATAGTIDDAATDLTSATGYVLDATITTDSSTSGTGTVTQAAGYGSEYHGNGSSSGGTLSTTFQPIAAANGVTDGDTMTLTERAKVSAIQKAANDYTDTLTVVAAGRF